MKPTIAVVSVCVQLCAMVFISMPPRVLGADASVAITNRVVLTAGMKQSLPIPVVSNVAGMVCAWFRPTGTNDGVLFDLGEWSLAYSDCYTNGTELFQLRRQDGASKTKRLKNVFKIIRPRFPERRHQVVMGWDRESVRLIINGGPEQREMVPTNGFQPQTITIGPGINGVLERVQFGDALASNEFFSGVEAAYDFESTNMPAMIAGSTRYGGQTQMAVMNGDGALGSRGFLRVGPHAGRWVITSLALSYAATAEMKLGFSVRKPGGGGMEVGSADRKQKKNVYRKFTLPKDGSWATFCFPVRWLGVEENTPLANINFDLKNEIQGPLYFDLDNICLFGGKPEEPPSSPAQVNSAFIDDAVRLTWSAPAALCGLNEYRIYRGLRENFPRDQQTLVGCVQQAVFTDTAFVHGGQYFYAVRAVDFAGNEGPDDGAHVVELKGARE